MLTLLISCINTMKLTCLNCMFNSITKESAYSFNPNINNRLINWLFQTDFEQDLDNLFVELRLSPHPDCGGKNLQTFK